MKNVLFIAALLTLSIAGCKKKEKDDNDYAAKIAGKWTITRIHYQYYVNGEEDGEDIELLSSDSYLQFNSDMTFDNFMKATDGSWQDSESGTYTVEKNQITLVGSDEPVLFTIKQLDKNNLVVENVDEYTESGIKYKDLMTVYMKR